MLRDFIDDGYRCVYMVKVFGDETCTHRGAAITAIAIYLGKPERWRKFKKPWQKCLKKFGVKAYHAVDLENFDGEFADWDETKKEQFVSELLPNVPEYTIQGLSCSILDTPRLRSAKELGVIRTEFRKDELPYLFCFLRLVKILGDGLIGKDRIAFVFEDNQYSSIAEKCFHFLKKTEKYGERLASITFTSKECAPQLQAADAFAFQTYKGMYRWWIDRLPPEETMEMRILNKKKTVGMLPYPAEWMTEEVREVADLVRQLRATRR